MAPSRSQRAKSISHSTLDRGITKTSPDQRRRSKRIADRFASTKILQQELPQKNTKKRKHDPSDINIVQESPLKRSKHSFDFRTQTAFTKDASVHHWCREGTWPADLITMGTSSDDELLARPRPRSLSRKRTNDGTEIESNFSGTSSQDGKSNEYESKQYPMILSLKGFHMVPKQTSPCREQGLDEKSKKKIQEMLDHKPRLPMESRFDEDRFEDTILRVNGQCEAKVIRDIGELIFPGPRFPSLPMIENDPITDIVDELWDKADQITKKIPKPDVSIGFDILAFTETQRKTLDPYIGSMAQMSSIAATASVLFPFMACKRKKAGGNVNTADNQNAHSMFFAVRAIVQLYKKAGCHDDLNGRVLAFSVSHSSEEIRIHAYYPVIKKNKTNEDDSNMNENENEKIIYHRHEIDRYLLKDHSRWKAFGFVTAVYKDWAPMRLAEIRQVIDRIPLHQAAKREAQRKKLEAQPTGLTQQMDASTVATDLHHLVSETPPEHLAPSSSGTSLSTPHDHTKAKASTSNGGSGSLRSTNRKK